MSSELIAIVLIICFLLLPCCALFKSSLLHLQRRERGAAQRILARLRYFYIACSIVACGWLAVAQSQGWVIGFDGEGSGGGRSTGARGYHK